MTNAQVKHMEPPNWWAGMQHDTLEVLFYGQDLASYIISSKEISILGIKKTENPNYQFVTIDTGRLSPGKYEFHFEKEGSPSFAKDFQIFERRQNSAKRKGFDSSDVMYLLMPDRFANGDPENDTVAGLQEKADRKKPGGRHGGDIQGIIDHLDYVQQLGVTTLWSTPLCQDDDHGYSYHGYAQSDVYQIDARYGSNEDYKRLAAELHERDMKLIKDYVTNHWGSEHWMIQDLPAYDWIHQFPGYKNSNYIQMSQMDPNTSQIDKTLSEDGWFVRTMPDLNQGNPLVLNYLIQNAIWWIEYADLDGLRVDTYSYNQKEGIALWTKAIMAEYPHLNIVGEIWMPETAQIAYWQKDSKVGAIQDYNSHLPSVMDFPLFGAVNHMVGEQQVWDKGIARVQRVLSNDFLYPDMNNLLVFVENHDTARYNEEAHGSLADYKLAMTIMATTRGIPQLYYGSEIGMRGKKSAGDADIRRDFPGGWKGDKNNAFLAPAKKNAKGGRTVKQEAYHAFTKKLFNWRKGSPAVHTGKLLHYVPEHNVYVYFRLLDEEQVMVIVNNNKAAQTFDLDRFEEGLGGQTTGKNIFTGRKVGLTGKMKIAGKTSMVLELE